MGMYCCCGQKIRDDWKCHCDWEEWISCCDYPEERKNKAIPFSDPEEEDVYLTRSQSACGSRYEEKRGYFKKPKKVQSGYTSKEFEVNWSGDVDEQPYAWKKND